MTGRSKGFGFCRFGDESERDRAIVEMAGHYINNRPIRVSTATARKAPSVPYPPNPADSKLHSECRLLVGVKSHLGIDASISAKDSSCTSTVLLIALLHCRDTPPI